jgi:DNA-binding CsgD family transcriptional regulator
MVCPALACGVLYRPPANPADVGPLPVHHLTDHEIAVLRLVADGRSNKWIGQQLSVSILTVEGHLARITHRLGTRGRAHMVAAAMRAGLIR